MKRAIIIIWGLLFIRYNLLFGQNRGVIKLKAKMRNVAINRANLDGRNAQPIAGYTMGTKIDDNMKEIININIKKNRLDKLFPFLYKMLYENYKSQVCNGYSCKPMLLYIKYYLGYRATKLYKKFIDFIQKQTASEIENIINKKAGKMYDLNAISRVIMVNPYAKNINKLLDIFFKESIENGSIRLVEIFAKYFNKLKIPVRVEIKKYLKIARLMMDMSFNNKKNVRAELKEEDSKMYELYKTGEVFTKEDLCKGESHDIDFANLEEVIQYPRGADSYGLETRDQFCFNIKSSGIYPTAVWGNQSCNNVSYFAYRDSNNVKKDILSIYSVASSIFYKFSKGHGAFNMLIQIPPKVTPVNENDNLNQLMNVMNVRSNPEWTTFSKTFFTKNYIVYSGNTLDNLSICYIHDSIVENEEKFMGKYCIFFDKKQISYDKYFVLDVNFHEDTKTLYALLAIEEGDFFKLTLYSFSIPKFSMKWKSGISAYSVSRQNSNVFGGSEVLVSIPKHSIIFSARGDVVILSKNYFVSVDRQTGIINFFEPLVDTPNPVRTSFSDNLIIQRGVDKIIFMGVDSSILYSIDIENGTILDELDLVEKGNDKTLTSYVIFVPGIIKNSGGIKNSLIYYAQGSQTYQTTEENNRINAINLDKFKKELLVPFSLAPVLGQVTFMNSNCKYIFLGTQKGVLTFTKDWKIASNDPNAELIPTQIVFSNKYGKSISVIPEYMFSYKNFLFVFTRSTLYLLSSSKKKR